MTSRGEGAGVETVRGRVLGGEDGRTGEGGAWGTGDQSLTETMASELTSGSSSCMCGKYHE